MKSKGIDSNIATQLAGMKLGSHRNPLIVLAATASTALLHLWRLPIPLTGLKAAIFSMQALHITTVENKALLLFEALWHHPEMMNWIFPSYSMPISVKQTSVDTFFSALSSRWNESSWNQFSSTDCADHQLPCQESWLLWQAVLEEYSLACSRLLARHPAAVSGVHG